MITVVIPYYKKKFFRQAIQSLATQTDKNFKVFVGDDASPEDCTDILNEFKGQLDLEYQRFDNNLGRKSLAKQWERCLKYITTEWFLILGDDDELSVNVIEVFNRADLAQYGVAKFNKVNIDENGDVSSDVFSYNFSSAAEFVVQVAEFKIVASLGEFAFKYDRFLKMGIADYPKAFYSDNWMVAMYSDFKEVPSLEAAVRVRLSPFALSGQPENSPEVYHAAALFFDLMANKYGNLFTTSQKKQFYKYILRGVLEKKLEKSKAQFITEAFRNLSVGDVLRIVMQMTKYRLLKK